MNFSRTRDYSTVRSILTSPDVYEHLTDDYAPHAMNFAINEHPDIWYVIVCHEGGITGLFSLIPRNRHCWEGHACMMPEASTQQKWEAARGLIPWLSGRTDCRRLVAEIPRSNKPAIYFTVHGVGLRYIGTHPKAFMKYGKLQDLVILGREV